VIIKNNVQQNIPLLISLGTADTDSKPTILTRAPVAYAPESNMVIYSRSPPPPNQHLLDTAATVTPSTTRVPDNKSDLPLVEDGLDPLSVRIVISPADSLRLEIESHDKHAKSCESAEEKTTAEILASSQQKEKE
jgi:hypothetical protein